MRINWKFCCSVQGLLSFSSHTLILGCSLISKQWLSGHSPLSSYVQKSPCSWLLASMVMLDIHPTLSWDSGYVVLDTSLLLIRGFGKHIPSLMLLEWLSYCRVCEQHKMFWIEKNLMATLSRAIFSPLVYSCTRASFLYSQNPISLAVVLGSSLITRIQGHAHQG